ncbi:hypothetical protein SESBI_37141 [Sesbania bispinosa]|nr:hypothetical protein SESBI_37141 [Sesbania bispinosa]
MSYVGRYPLNKYKEAYVDFSSLSKINESIECGYYVMRHMLNIISADIVDSWTERFNNQDPFTQEEIDDIQIRWANYLLNNTNV